MRKRRRDAYVSTGVRRAKRRCWLNITQSRWDAITLPGGRGGDGKLMARSRQVLVYAPPDARLVRADGPCLKVWLTLTVNSPAPSRGRPPSPPVRQTAAAQNFCSGHLTKQKASVRHKARRYCLTWGEESPNFFVPLSWLPFFPPTLLVHERSHFRRANGNVICCCVYVCVCVCSCVRVCACARVSHLAYSTQIAQMWNSRLWSQRNKTCLRQKTTITFDFFHVVNIVLRKLLDTTNINHIYCAHRVYRLHYPHKGFC